MFTIQAKLWININDHSLQFWKQFFESSANVSLSGYEEQTAHDSSQDATVTEDYTETTQTLVDETLEYYGTTTPEHSDRAHRDLEPDISSLSISDSHSTPRAADYIKKTHDNSSIDYTIQSEDMEEGVSSIDTPSQINKAAPSTPGKNMGRHPRNIPTTPGSIVFPPPTSLRSNKTKSGKSADPVLHRVLDKTYRVQATPLGGSRTLFRGQSEITTPKLRYNLDPSPMSSPELEAPKLHSEIFSSPVAPMSINRPRKTSKPRSPKPGISVLTPSKSKTHRQSLWDSDDDLEDDDVDPTAFFGHSPPKTMQFHVPQNKLLKTPGTFRTLFCIFLKSLLALAWFRVGDSGTDVLFSQGSVEAHSV